MESPIILTSEEKDLIDTWRKAIELLSADDPNGWQEGTEKLHYCRDLIGVSTDYLPTYS